MHRRAAPRHVAGILGLVGALLVALPSAAAPKAELWERWTAHDPAATRTVDHGLWDAFLRTHVRAHPSGVNRVAYGEVDARSRASLDRYLRDLAAIPVSALARPEQKAFWINLYNALTVRVVLDHFPVASIRDIDISPGLFSSGPWGAKLIEIEGEQLGLDDIEHRILRPIWRDARVHYAVNCASIGCPNLRGHAYAAADLDAALDAAARDFVNHPRGARVERGRLRVSSIYVWFVEDFGGDDAGVIAHLRRHAEPALADALVGVAHVDGDDYDWSLNAP
ncbi:MAG: DUF547 domain-containing protein [Ectothiorhodospiraceae bacterium]|nr:DUF547 domain-containing protein [Ectothiorhodospiraceae bacterium]